MNEIATEVQRRLTTEMQHRTNAAVLRESINEEARTVDIAWASEQPVERWFGLEVLDCAPDSVRMNRLNDGAAVLFNHDPNRLIGVVEQVLIGSELIAYSTATLTGPNRYDLSGYIKRGQRCTLSEAHVAGESFLRLDGAVQRFNVTEASVGHTLYVKLLSFNRTGGGQQTLDQVSAIEYVVQPLGVVAVNGAVPSTVTAQQVLCIPPTGQYSVQGRMTCAGRINCDGRLIIS